MDECEQRSVVSVPQAHRATGGRVGAHSPAFILLRAASSFSGKTGIGRYAISRRSSELPETHNWWVF